MQQDGVTLQGRLASVGAGSSRCVAVAGVCRDWAGRLVRSVQGRQRVYRAQESGVRSGRQAALAARCVLQQAQGVSLDVAGAVLCC
jgi:hypothetical protein